MKNIPAIEGGLPLREDYLIFGSPAIEEDEINDVVDSLRSGWVGTGPKVKRFEDAFRDYIGARYAVALNSCTAALHLSLLAIGVGSGDEVVTTPMTFTATSAAIIHAGATPVFVDIDRKTMTMDPEKMPPVITERTKAILPVHFAGRPCPMEAIMEIAREYDLKVVEDAAHGIETMSQGRKVGTIGDLSCFSFYVTKNIVTGEGGMVTTNEEALADWIKILALHGMTRDAWHRFSDEGFRHYDVIYPGFKYNMMDIQAALGYHQLKRIEQYAERRKVIWELYNRAFRGLPVLIPPDDLMPGDRHAYHLYTLLLKLEDLKISRDRFIAALHRENIGSGVHYRALHLHPFYSKQYNLRPGMFPESEFVSERTVSLPFSAKLTDADVDNVIKAVSRILNYYAK
jgi:dTDP-4-amino-4,6-dideoxygalactose transaminase